MLLHVLTRKGKGYDPAEKNPVYFHGVGCFDVDNGNSTAHDCGIPSYTEVFGDTIVRLAAKNDRVVAVTAAMPEGTGLTKFAQTYPDRFYDVGIAEQHGVTFAAGMATCGFRPVVAIYSTFLQRAYDQVLHDVCIESLPVVFALDRGGIVGEDGSTHHGLFDFSYLRSLPNMTLMAPKDENEMRRMLLSALEHNGPAALRYPRGTAVGVSLDREITPLAIGRGEVLRPGQDVLIIAIGACVHQALEAADLLEESGISAAVINGRFVKPLDEALILEWAEKVPRIVTVEENVCQGGFGTAVLECLADADIPVNIRRMGLPDEFVEHGAQKILRKRYGLDAAAIAAQARELAERS